MSEKFQGVNFVEDEFGDAEFGFDKEIEARKREMGKMLVDLDPDQQGFVNEITSFFLEGDLYDQYKKDASGIKDLYDELEVAGLTPEQAKTVLRYLNFPIPQ